MTGTRIIAGQRVANARLPQAKGVTALYDGLLTNGGGAQASYVEGWNRTDGFELEVVFRTPKTAQGYEIARRYADGKGWFVRITAAGDISISTGFGTNTVLTNYSTTSAPLKDTWGGKLIGVKVMVNCTTKKIRRWLSVDGGVTYAELGSGSTMGDPEAAKGLQPTTAPLVVPSGTTAQNGVSLVRLVALRDVSSTSIIGITFGTVWPPYTSIYYSPSGSTWTLTGAAVIGSTTVASPV